MVSNVAPDAGGSSSAPSSVRGSVNSSQWNSSSDVHGRQASTGSLAGVRQSREGGHLSSVLRDFVAKARSLGTSNAYKFAWGKFSRWCAAQQANAFSCPVEVIVNFLAEQQCLVQFNMLTGYRSAISFYHDLVDGVPIGRHPLVFKLLKCSFRYNLPVPRYTQIWDVQILLSNLQELDPNAGLTQKELTLKLTMLLALVCRARGHELCAVNPQAICWYHDKVTCHILEVTKTKTVTKLHWSFDVLRCNTSNNLDQVKCLEAYLNLTAKQRVTIHHMSYLFCASTTCGQNLFHCTMVKISHA